MDTLTTLALFPLTAAAAGAALATRGALIDLGTHLAHKRRVREVRREVARATDEHAARPIPRRRHDHHCPACGRFARVTSSSERGVWTRCAAHGIRLRATRRIGAHEVAEVITLVVHRPLGIEPPPITSPLAIMPPLRRVDWLDDIAPLAPSRRVA